MSLPSDPDDEPIPTACAGGIVFIAGILVPLILLITQRLQ